MRNRLATLIEKSPDGTFVETDAAVRTAAEKALDRIDNQRMLYSAIETLFFGLSLGSVLVLIAIGLAITFGVMGVINMAHGELMMLGAYTTYLVQVAMPQHLDALDFRGDPGGLRRCGDRRHADRADDHPVSLRQAARDPAGDLRPQPGAAANGALDVLGAQPLRVNAVLDERRRCRSTKRWAITYNRLYIVLFTVIVFVMLLVVLKRTRLGLDIRAVSQNRAMAQAMGVRSDWVDAMTFGLGSGIAGVAGVALSQLTNVGPNLGQAYIIDSFMVVVFGGVGNLWGTLIGGMSLGIINKLLEPYSGAVLAKIFVLVALILFIQRRPRGLFPQTGRAAESS